MSDKKRAFRVTLKIHVSAFDEDDAGDQALSYLYGQEVYLDDPDACAEVLDVEESS